MYVYAYMCKHIYICIDLHTDVYIHIYVYIYICPRSQTAQHCLTRPSVWKRHYCCKGYYTKLAQAYVYTKRERDARVITQKAAAYSTLHAPLANLLVAMHASPKQHGGDGGMRRSGGHAHLAQTHTLTDSHTHTHILQHTHATHTATHTATALISSCELMAHCGRHCNTHCNTHCNSLDIK